MAKAKQEDPWAGFVDVLSSILMVVIFLVVILGVAIFAISQQVTKAAVESAIKAEQEKQTQPPVKIPPPDAPVDAQNTPVAMLKEELRTPLNEAKQSQQPPLPSSETPPAIGKEASVPDKKEGEQQNEAPRNVPVRQNDIIEGKNKLTVRSVAVAPTHNIEIATEEVQKPEDENSQIVKASQAILALKFKTGSYRIDQSSAQEMCKHMEADILNGPSILEIRSIANTGNDSVSDSRRIAYYRGMQTRAELIKCGIAEARIAVKLREAGQGENGDNVQVFVKP